MSVNQCYNDLKIDSFKYEWTIKNFALHVKLWLLSDNPLSTYHGPMKSPSFYLNDDHTKWYLGLSIFSSSNYTIGLWAEFQDEKQYPTKKIKIQCTFVNNNTKKKCDGDNTYHIFSSARKQYYPITLGTIPTDLLSNDIKDSDYDISVICNFHIVVDSYTSATVNPISKMIEKNISTDIEELFYQKKFTDLTFILGNKKIEAHKTILMVRSPVFAAMFSHAMKEKNSNEVQICDIDYEVFKEMLRYIYTDDVSNLKCSPGKLFYAADKYGLKNLKEICGVLLQKGITINNAADVFIFADQHNLTQFSENIRRFIRDHIGDFLNSPGYENMVEKYPNLVFKILKSPASKP